MNAIEIKGLRKQYGGFTLGGLDFYAAGGLHHRAGGRKRRGESTLLRLIVGMTRPDAASFACWGAAGRRRSVPRAAGGYRLCARRDLFPRDAHAARRQGAVLSRAYSRWDAASYAALLERFALPVRKPVRELSRGMKMKLSLAAALAHRPRLLVLDEATGGLDPVARDGILDLLNDFTRRRDAYGAAVVAHPVRSGKNLRLRRVPAERAAAVLRGKGPPDRVLRRRPPARAGNRRAAGERRPRPPPELVLPPELLVRRDALPRGFTAERTTLEEIVLLLSASAETKEKIV